MNKVQIATKDQSIMIRMPDKAANQFYQQLAMLVLAYDADHENKVPEESATAIDTDSENQEDKAREEVVEVPQENLKPEGYFHSGFMYLKCPKCGIEKGFCSKKSVDGYYCESCGTLTEFQEPLRKMVVNCECGSIFRYWTNMNEYAFDMKCLNCGAPVAVKYNKKKDAYETIK